MRASHLVLAVLAVLFLTASHAAKEYEVSGTLTNCTVTETGGGFHETCDLESADAMFAGTWSFTYEADDDDQGVMAFDDGEELVTHEYDPDEVVLQFGEAVIDTDDGPWEGGVQRFLASANGPALDEFWVSSFVDDRVRPAADDRGAWVIGGSLSGEEDLLGLELHVGGAGDVPGAPYALDGWIQPEESEEESDEGADSLLLQRLTTAAIALIALSVLAIPAVISALKGRWWMGVVGFVAVVGWLAFLFTVTEDPSQEFQETALFTILELLLQIALPGGLLLLLVGALLRARPGSWWDRNRSKALEDELT